MSYYTVLSIDSYWDVVKYTNVPELNNIVLKTDEYTYTESKTIKRSLSWEDASNLATILNKLHNN